MKVQVCTAKLSSEGEERWKVKADGRHAEWTDTQEGCARHSQRSMFSLLFNEQNQILFFI